MKAPTGAEPHKLTRTIAARIGRFVQRQGLLAQDAETAYLTGEGVEPGPPDQLIGHAITDRIGEPPRSRPGASLDVERVEVS